MVLKSMPNSMARVMKHRRKERGEECGNCNRLQDAVIAFLGSFTLNTFCPWRIWPRASNFRRNGKSWGNIGMAKPVSVFIR
jgi:hypothetical protein